MKRSRLWLGMVACILSSCGIDELKKLAGQDDENEYESECIDSVSPAVQEQNQDLDAAAEAARWTAVEAERSRLGASALLLDQFIDLDRRADDKADPYPEAVPLHLDDASKKNDLPAYYSQFHGYDGARTVYETKPGSKQYFIVDEVHGDGAGSAGIVGAASGLNTGSMHSWHATPDNKLVRLKAEPTYETLSSVSICGCGPSQTEAGGSFHLDQASPDYPKGIFLLPGDQVPTLHDEVMSIQFVDQSIEIKYVPRKGKRCESPVC